MKLLSWSSQSEETTQGVNGTRCAHCLNQVYEHSSRTDDQGADLPYSVLQFSHKVYYILYNTFMEDTVDAFLGPNNSESCCAHTLPLKTQPWCLTLSWQCLMSSVAIWLQPGMTRGNFSLERRIVKPTSYAEKAILIHTRV